MRTYSTSDPIHNDYVIAVAEAIGRHTQAVREAPEGTEPEPTTIEIPGGGTWSLTLVDVAPRWQVTRGDGKALRFADGLDPVAAVMRACDHERPVEFALTAEASRVIAHA